MPALKITKLNKAFKGFQAVKDLDLEVGENKVFGFLGPNGAGKTTTIRTIVGLSKPDSGTIEICGEKANFGETKTHRLFGYLPEQPSFYLWMTGVEYLKFIFELFSLKPTKEEIEKLLKSVGLFESKNKRIGSYSNGMKQRLGIAQALVGNPKILIFDEPVSALDPIGRKEVLDIIEELKKTKTIFMSTHILGDVDRICDDVAILNKGKLIVQSSLSDLKTKYSTSILEIEFAKDPDFLLSALKKEKWVKKIDKTGNHLKIWITDKKYLLDNTPLRFFGDKNNGILSYDYNMPEIEDLFMELVGERNV